MLSRPAVVLFALVAGELVILSRVSAAVGAGNAVLALAVLSGLGIVLLRRGGVGFFEATAQQLSNAGDEKAAVVADRAMVALAAVLLILPGFLTAAVGALLFVPPIRAFVRPKVLHRIQPWIHTNLQFGRVRRYGRDVVDVDIVDVDSHHESSPSRPELS